RAQKYELLSQAHVFTMPSIYPEAKGLPVLEALSVGVPVVQPRSGSFPELLDATGGGLLFDPQEPGDFASKLGALMDDAPLRHSLGHAGAQAVRAEFSDAKMADATWRSYGELLSRPR